MKTLINTIAFFLLLAGILQANAQSNGQQSGNTGQRSSASASDARKAQTSQTQGKGVPYNKDAEQRRSQAKGGMPTPSNSTTGNSAGSGRKNGQNTAKSGKPTSKSSQ